VSFLSGRATGPLLAAAAVFLLIYVILEGFFGRSRMQRRIAELRVFHVGTRQETEPLLTRMRMAGGLLVERSERLTAYAQRAEPLLDRTADPIRPTEWLAIRLGIALLLMIILDAILPWWAGLPLGAVAGFVATGRFLRARIARREKTFADDLPNTLQLVLSSLRSGFTLQQSVDAAVRDDDGPVAEELRRALSESRINGEFEDALARAGERIRSQEMIWLVMAIRLQREVGGSLADVMQTTADTMRERAFLRRHVRALSAEGRISAYILTGLPIAVGVLLYFMRPEYVGLLFKEPLGLAMLAAAVVFMLIGTLWLRSSVRIEV
jgi:tight adherence protein B